MRCSVHGIAAAPDGRCVLCRRAARERNAEQSPGRAVKTGIVLGIVLLVVALAGARTLVRRSAERPAEPAPEGAPVAARRIEDAPTREPAEAAETRETAVPTDLPALPDRVPSDSPAIPEPPAEPLATASADPAPAPTAAATATLTNAELRAALSAVPIVMFSASWCGVCDRARDFLRANDCSFVERDIDHDPAAQALLRSRFGKVSVPVMEVDGRLQRPGFSERTIVAELTRSVERRLGVRGIRTRSRDQ